LKIFEINDFTKEAILKNLKFVTKLFLFTSVLSFMIACSTTETVEVIKEVPVEKVVEKVVEKEVIKEVIKEVAPAPTYAKSINVRDVFFFTEGFTPPRGGSFFEHRISQQIYEGLTALNTPMVTRGDSAVPVPNLAESWEISGGGTTYTFQIRDGVKFTTGNPLTGQAVVDSLKRSIHVIELDKATARFSWVTDIVSIDATGDMEVTMVLKNSFAPLLAILASKQFLIVDAAELKKHEEEGDWGAAWGATNSVGTAAYQIDSWVAEQRLTLKRNKDYWGGHDGVGPGADQLVFSNIPENATAELMISKGEVDVALQMDPISLKTLDLQPKVYTFSYPSLITCNFLIDRRNEHAANDEIFKAIHMAIDYDGLLSVVAMGLGSVHQSLILPGMLGHDPAISNQWKYEPEKAKAIIAEQGYPDGFSIKLQSRAGACGSVVYTKGIEFLQASLKKAGINAEIVQSTGSKFWGQIIDGTLKDMGISGLGATYFDPDNPASVRATSECFLLGIEEHNPTVAAKLKDLVAQGRAETDNDKRHTIYRELNEIMVANCGEMTVLQVADTVALRTNITDGIAMPHGFSLDFRYLRKAE
tara:strand:- start:5332 stop:7095 length:1764 start_codon:yes stop_codon:yes gene_type:complete